MNVILLCSNHQHVLATHVAIFSVMRTRYNHNHSTTWSDFIYNYVCILVIIMNMAT